MMETKIQQVSIALIDSPANAVREVDEASVSELCDSVKAVGVLQPILVRPKGERYEIVFGNHRFQAALKAGLSEIPCHVAVLSDSEALLLSVTENIQRLEMNPFREGEVYAILLQEFTCATLATRLGKSQEYINRRVLLFSKLSPDLRPEVGQRLTLGQALAFCKLPFSEQKTLFQRVQGVRAEMVNSTLLSPPGAKPSCFPVVDAESLRIAEEKAKAVMETCFKCAAQIREEQSYVINEHVYCVKCALHVKENNPIDVSDKAKKHRITGNLLDSQSEILLCPKCGNPLERGESRIFKCANSVCPVITVKFVFIKYDAAKAKQIAVSVTA